MPGPDPVEDDARWLTLPGAQYRPICERCYGDPPPDPDEFREACKKMFLREADELARKVDRMEEALRRRRR